MIAGEALVLAFVLASGVPAFVDDNVRGCSDVSIRGGSCREALDLSTGIEFDPNDSANNDGPGGRAPGTPVLEPSCYAVPGAICRDPYTVTRPVTIEDLASFRPDAGVQHMEPNGWGIAGLDTNFFATVGGQILAGDLLGRPAEVRFTPVAYAWDYGDGTRTEHASPGGSWSASGAAEFEPTATSHVYERRGRYAATLTVRFGAEYRYDGGAWVPVQGTLRAVAPALSVQVVTGSTALVGSDCDRRTTAPGC